MDERKLEAEWTALLAAPGGRDRWERLMAVYRRQGRLDEGVARLGETLLGADLDEGAARDLERLVARVGWGFGDPRPVREPATLRTVACSPDGDVLYLSSGDGTLEVRDGAGWGRSRRVDLNSPGDHLAPAGGWQAFRVERVLRGGELLLGLLLWMDVKSSGIERRRRDALLDVGSGTVRPLAFRPADMNDSGTVAVRTDAGRSWVGIRSSPAALEFDFREVSALPPGGVLGMALSPDGHTLAALVETGRERSFPEISWTELTLGGPAMETRGVTLAETELTLISTDRLEVTASTPAGCHTVLARSRDGARYLTSLRSRGWVLPREPAVTLWKAEPLADLGSWKFPEHQVCGASFHSRRFLAVSLDSDPCILPEAHPAGIVHPDPQPRDHPREAAGLPNFESSRWFSVDGSSRFPERELPAVAYQSGGSVHVEKGDARRVLELTASWRPALGELSLSPDGRRLLAAYERGGLCPAWDLASGDPLEGGAQSPFTPLGAVDRLRLEVRPSPMGAGYTLRRIPGGERVAIGLLRRGEPAPCATVVDEEQGVLAFAWGDGLVVWTSMVDGSTGQVESGAPSRCGGALHLDADGQRLAWLPRAGTPFVVIDREQAAVTATFTPGVGPGEYPERFGPQEPVRINELPSGDGYLIGWGGGAHLCRLGRPAAPAVPAELPTGLVALAPDGDTLALVCETMTIELWSLSGPRRLDAFRPDLWPVRDLCFSPDGDRLFYTQASHVRSRLL